MIQKNCPHCGAPLPEDASFCPVCAEIINPRTGSAPPRPIPRRLLRAGLLIVLAAAVLVGIWLWNRPRTYEGMAEVIYTDKDGTYQLVLGNKSDRYTAVPDFTTPLEPGNEYRKPSRLFINHQESGADAGEVFRKKIVSATAEFITEDGGESGYESSAPEYMDAVPEAALVSLVDYTENSRSPAQLVWTITMENGDTIRLLQNWNLQIIQTFDYYPEDEAMETAADLQALADRLAETTDPNDVVNLHLPAVTYDEPLILQGRRPFNLYGAEGADPTVFAAGIQMRDQEAPAWISTFQDLVFRGDGSGVGLSTAGRVWTQNCTFTGWKTGLLAYGSTWANATDCVFTDNAVGLDVNISDGQPSDESFTGNQFTGNDTAVLLEAVPTDVVLNFEDSVFRENGTDIDNRCNQPLDIAKAVFQ